MARRRFTILGCGSSPGVPRINGDWGACDPANPRNRRTRASLLVEQISANGSLTTAVIDTGPDFRYQMIRAKVEAVHGVIYTHPHADHIHGIDDLRGFYHSMHKRIPIHADQFTMDRLREGFGYCMETPPGSNYPPIVTPHIINESFDAETVIDGPGGSIGFLPVAQRHGDIRSLGFRIGNVAYCSDVSDFPHGSLERLAGLDVLIIDALQYEPHPSHLSLRQALSWIDVVKPKRAILTHMHTPLDYDRVMGETPAHVEPAHDGLQFELEIP